MTKKEIFSEVLNIVRTDASFIKEKPFLPADESRISEEMTDEEFVFAVNSYLCGYGVPWHLHFYKRGPQPYAGFGVRRYQGDLYVVSAQTESGLKLGDKIAELDGKSVQAVADEYKEFLFGESEERQGQFWENFLIPRFGELTVVRGGKTLRLPVKRLGRAPSAPCEFRDLGGGTVYLRFDNFFGDEPVKNLLEEHAEALRAPNLIIDVRNNCGGTDTAFLPLLSLCLKEGESPDFSPDKMEVNYTERNSDLRLRILEDYRRQATADVLPYFDKAIEEVKRMRGRGFCRVEGGENISLKGTALPERVAVLCDDGCGSSGEAFVLAAAECSKVTVVGRPSMGILKYSNLARVEFGEFALSYPTSKSYGKARAEAEIYVPWTPEHLERDADLEKALEMIKKPYSKN